MKKKIFKYFEWSLIVTILLLYVTGLHTEALAGFQRLMLNTGIMKPDFGTSDQELKDANYDMKLLSVDGEIIDMKSLKGKTIFINFWATWCAPCVAEMSGINNLYNRVKDENTVFLMISSDMKPDKIKKFMAKNEYSLPAYQMASEVPAEYYSKSIPATFVVSPEGKIVMKKIGIADYDNNPFEDFLIKLKEKPDITPQSGDI